MPARKLVNRFHTLAIGLTTALVGLSQGAQAGDFTIDWTVLDWPAGSTSPFTRTISDQYGFEIDLNFDADGNYGSGAGLNTPDEGNIFGGGVEAIVFISDAPFQSGRIGDATVSATMSFSSGGIAFPVDNLMVDTLDIDASDNNSSTDRCDFVTITGDNGNPTLATVGPSPTVLVGPGVGSGATGVLAANQAQCIYVDGSGVSPTSNNDINGTIRATFPNDTASVTFIYDESIGNVRTVAGYNPAARGIATLGGAEFEVPQSISMTRTVTPNNGAQGSTVTYSYTVTNNGGLPVNTGQDIVIEDDLLGTVSCPAVSAPIAPGGTVTCQATYTITAADVLTGTVDSNAVAGIGAIGQPFSTRLQTGSVPLSFVSSAITGGGPGSMTCTPQSVFSQPRTQLAGSGTNTNLGLSDIFLFDDVTSDINGNPIDVVFQLEQIDSVTSLELTTGLKGRMTASNDPHVIYRIRLVQDGTATPSNPLGTAVEQSRINGVIVQQTDVDSRNVGDDSSDVVGPIETPTTISHFNTAPLASYPSGGNAIAMDPARFGNPLDWTDEPNESDFDNYATYEFDTFVEARFIHGYTGSSTNAATRGSGILLCAIANTSPDVVAVDDDFTASPINTVLGGTAGEVLNNDTINGLPAAFPTAELEVLSPAVPQNLGDPVPVLEVSGTDAGRVIVPPNVPAGVYVIEYRLCDALDTTDCDRAKVTIAVFSGLGVDFGDAPISYLTPSHGVDAAPGVYLGSVPPDIELVAQSDAAATADDLVGTDDEDGIIFPVLTQGTISTLNVNVTGLGALQAWIDFNGDGVFEDSLGERIALDLRDDGTQFDNVAGDGVVQVDVTVPSDATTSTTFARFRYGSETGLSAVGFAVDGEVEDFSLVIAAADLSDRGDAPATYGDPRHIVVDDIFLGAGLPDTEQVPQNSVEADADDLDGIDDEDSIAVFPVLEAGTTQSLTVQTHETLSLQLALGIPVATGITNLQVWIDFDQSGTFDLTEQVAVNYRDGGTGDTDGVFNNQITFDIPVPNTISSGFSYARIRWSTSSALAVDPFDGLNFDGEVEDYRVTLSAGAIPFTCDGTLYRVARVDSQLQRLDFSESGGAYSISTSNVGTPAGAAYDGGWGYNALDGLFYAVRVNARDLIRLDSAGRFDVVATVPLTAAEGHDTGDILSNGIMIYRVQGSNEFQLLDLNDPTTPLDVGRITLTSAVDPFDIAYNPNDGMIYGVNHTTDRLFFFDPSDGTPGARTPVDFGPAVWDQEYGAVWFDFYGRMYVNQNTSNEVYEVDVGINGTGTGVRALIDTLSVSDEFRNDGVSCPSRFGPLPPNGALSGVVYRDTNYSAAYDSGETLLNPVTVMIYNDNGTPADLTDDVLVATDATGTDGRYQFTDLAAVATYRIEVDEADPDLPPGLTVNGSNPYTGVTITAGSERDDFDFGFVAGASTADLSLSKAAFDTSAQPLIDAAAGTTIDFVLSVANDGPDNVTNVDVQDRIPSGFTYVSDTAGAQGDLYDPDTGIWNVGDVANGTTETLTIRVTMNATGEHTNSAEIIASSLPDPDSDPDVGAKTDDLGDGIADDDEASVSITFLGTGATLSGKVFLDNGSGGDTAYDAIQGSGEFAIDQAVVTLLDSTATVIGTPELSADGSWSLTLPEGYADTVTVQVTPNVGFATVSEAPGAVPTLVNADPRDGSFTFTPASGATYTDLNVGMIESATLTQGQVVTIRPGQVITLRHEYLADADGTVLLETDIQSISAPGAFSVSLFRDVACDGTIGAAINGGLPITPDTRICVIARVVSSSGASVGSVFAFDVVADTTYGTSGLVEQIRNTDTVKVESSEGTLKIRKTVRNITQATPEGVSNGAAAGDVLEYRIYVENPGSLPATQIRIYDRTPPYTSLAAPIASPVNVGSDVVCTVGEPAANLAGYAGTLRWDCTGAHPPGASGDVSFQVQITP